MLKYFNAGSLGQIQIEQNEAWARCTVIGVGCVDKFDGALSVAHNMKVGQNCGCDGLPHEKHIRLIVIDQQDLMAVLQTCTTAGMVK